MTNIINSIEALALTVIGAKPSILSKSPIKATELTVSSQEKNQSVTLRFRAENNEYIFESLTGATELGLKELDSQISIATWKMFFMTLELHKKENVIYDIDPRLILFLIEFPNSKFTRGIEITKYQKEIVSVLEEHAFAQLGEEA